jgi:hypothetical protein
MGRFVLAPNEVGSSFKNLHFMEQARIYSALAWFLLNSRNKFFPPVTRPTIPAQNCSWKVIVT